MATQHGAEDGLHPLTIATQTSASVIVLVHLRRECCVDRSDRQGQEQRFLRGGAEGNEKGVALRSRFLEARLKAKCDCERFVPPDESCISPPSHAELSWAVVSTDAIHLVNGRARFRRDSGVTRTRRDAIRGGSSRRRIRARWLPPHAAQLSRDPDVAVGLRRIHTINGRTTAVLR
jgi:hypothetical protein